MSRIRDNVPKIGTSKGPGLKDTIIYNNSYGKNYILALSSIQHKELYPFYISHPHHYLRNHKYNLKYLFI